MKSISVVIPNYNGKHLLEQNLPAVFDALQAIKDFEVIVADDASTDDSITYLETYWQNVIQVKNKINGGFSKNINSGFKQATKDLVLALNSDVRLDKNYFLPQLKYFENPATFGVMGSIYNKDKLIDAAKYPVWKFGKLVTTLNVAPINPTKQWIPTLFLSGANALMDRKKLMQLEGMDQIYSPFYMEDVDLSVRAWRMAWHCYYEADATCTHILSSTITANYKKAQVNLVSKRNKLLFHFLHTAQHRRLFWITEIALNLLLRWVVFSLDYYHTFYLFLKARKNTKKKQYQLSLNKVIRQIQLEFLGLPKKMF